MSNTAKIVLQEDLLISPPFLWCSEEPSKGSLRSKVKELSLPRKRRSGIATTNQCPDVFAASSVRMTRDILLLGLGSLWGYFYINFYNSLPPFPCFSTKVCRSCLSHSDYTGVPWALLEQRKCRDATGTWPPVNLMWQLKPESFNFLVSKILFTGFQLWENFKKKLSLLYVTLLYILFHVCLLLSTAEWTVPD